MGSVFKFKQFSISQDKTAMKVGTDGVLLGAWTHIEKETNTILDIGTGTGLIALMLAQRCSGAHIDAVELNDEAYVQAVGNFENSPWADRLFCFHAAIQELAEDPEEKYDLIISNPPYFNLGKDKFHSSREMARQHVTLSYEVLLACTARLLAENGSCAFIIPFQSETNFLEIAENYHLSANRITHVRGTDRSRKKRSLVQLSFVNTEVIRNELVIEISRHQYTKSYTQLVKEFYLKM